MKRIFGKARYPEVLIPVGNEAAGDATTAYLDGIELYCTRMLSDGLYREDEVHPAVIDAWHAVRYVRGALERGHVELALDYRDGAFDAARTRAALGRLGLEPFQPPLEMFQVWLEAHGSDIEALSVFAAPPDDLIILDEIMEDEDLEASLFRPIRSALEGACIAMQVTPDVFEKRIFDLVARNPRRFARARARMVANRQWELEDRVVAGLRRAGFAQRPEIKVAVPQVGRRMDFGLGDVEIWRVPTSRGMLRGLNLGPAIYLLDETADGIDCEASLRECLKEAHGATRAETTEIAVRHAREWRPAAVATNLLEKAGVAATIDWMCCIDAREQGAARYLLDLACGRRFELTFDEAQVRLCDNKAPSITRAMPLSEAREVAAA